ncbi:MAG: hypothetical protein OMM_03115 [Candidatus Magnetoglobus multicellularis str. Araruama]|uniref:Cohesin domain-containing protein n=1 Tax=Candidatus Magnetoglobus multicellularis str. Araruama TaxID=890399 RepID=A0A1V1P6U7_9BACT|nr:MAG: hypothetical protein OMM_03115 [Candidatus Magnetoglobus multicellularis str. Araruama]
MKKHWFCTLYFLIVFSLFLPPAFAYQIFSDPISGDPEEDICVPIHITDIDDPFNIKTIGFDVEYNPNHLSNIQLKTDDTLIKGAIAIVSPLENKPDKKVTFFLSDPVTITDDAILVNICFSIGDNALESESITLTNFQDDIAGANVDIPEFEYRIFSDPVRGNFNEEQCVPIRITDIKNSLEIHQFGFDITYNRHHLNYIRFNTAESLSKDYTIETSVNEETSQVTFDGTASSIPIAITEDTILINTCFKLEKALESEPITLTGFREDIDRANIDYSNLPSSYLSQNISNEDSDIGECFIQLITVDFSVFFGNQKNCLKRSSPR